MHYNQNTLTYNDDIQEDERTIKFQIL
jgi:hypothetical protein